MLRNPTVRVINSNSTASIILDILRFSLALIVFLFHFFVPLPGYQAVMVFFVLSGYFISSTVLKAITGNRWSWSDYLVKRIIRLWVVLIPCLVLTYIWAKAQFVLFGINETIFQSLNWKNFLGNIFFLQGVLVNEYGLNGPLWSLSYEFWYYILFPCLVLSFYTPRKPFKIFYALIFVGISFFVGERIMLYFLVWLLGAVIPLLKPIKFQNEALNYLILVFAVILAIYSMNYQGDWQDIKIFFHDIKVGITFSFLIYFITSMFKGTSFNAGLKVSKELSGFSYTLYLAHYPVANFVFAWLYSPLWPFSETPFIVKVSMMVFVLIYAWIIALLTEKHTERVRIIVLGILDRINKEQIVNERISDRGI